MCVCAFFSFSLTEHFSFMKSICIFFVFMWNLNSENLLDSVCGSIVSVFRMLNDLICMLDYSHINASSFFRGSFSLFASLYPFALFLFIKLNRQIGVSVTRLFFSFSFVQKYYESRTSEKKIYDEKTLYLICDITGTSIHSKMTPSTSFFSHVLCPLIPLKFPQY